MKEFIHENFLLPTDRSRHYYFNFAESCPIFDYHSHLSSEEISKDRQFENLTQLWLEHDHYKWRALRANGIDESLITGNASDLDKFKAWGRTVPKTLRNPLYHWTHMELKKPFGIHDLLNEHSAEAIYERTREQLQKSEFSAKSLLKTFNVKVVCTTDDPVDDLKHHLKLREDQFEVKVLPTFRAEWAARVQEVEPWQNWIQKLSEVSGIDIQSIDLMFEALDRRHAFFHKAGCRLSDHDMRTPAGAELEPGVAEKAFLKALKGEELSIQELHQYRSLLFHELARMDAKRGWTQQLHIGALRNNNSRLMSVVGNDAGCDSIGDPLLAAELSKMLDRLDVKSELPKTILYNLNPRDNEMMATMCGNFQDGTFPGKIQYGAAWWFNDQKEGIERQINTLSNFGLLPHFVGMLTDSRSLLSYSRHEYFRRVFCTQLAEDVELGLLPDDNETMAELIRAVCWENAKQYFNIEVPDVA